MKIGRAFCHTGQDQELRDRTSSGEVGADKLAGPSHAPQAIGVIAHPPCSLICIILHRAIRYGERRPAVSRSRQNPVPVSLQNVLM
jgi:hypothetical protein